MYSRRREGDYGANPSGTWKVAALAAAGIAAWGLSKLFGSASEEAGPQDDEARLGGMWKVAAVAAGISALAWGVSKLFGSASEEAEPQYDEAIPGETWKAAALAAAGIAASAWGVSKLYGSASEEAEQRDNRKRMKAPGRNGQLMYRDDFVNEPPRDYFRQLRDDKKRHK